MRAVHVACRFGRCGPPTSLSSSVGHECGSAISDLADCAIHRVDYILSSLVSLGMGILSHKSKLEGWGVRSTGVVAPSSHAGSTQHFIDCTLVGQGAAERGATVAGRGLLCSCGWNRTVCICRCSSLGFLCYEMMQLLLANNPRQPTPGARLGCNSASLARRGCAGVGRRNSINSK